MLLEPTRRYGHAALVVDHMHKDGTGGRYARGSGDKLAAIDVAYILMPVTAFHREQSGLARLTVTKDRRGWLHRDHELRVEVDHGAMRVTITPAAGTPARMPPARGKLLDALRAANGAPRTVPSWSTGSPRSTGTV